MATFRQAIIGLLLISATFFALGCHADEIHILYVNKTQRTVTISVDSEILFELSPGESVKGGTLKRFLPDHIQAMDSSGGVHLDQVYDDDDLKAVDYTIVVR